MKERVGAVPYGIRNTGDRLSALRVSAATRTISD